MQVGIAIPHTGPLAAPEFVARFCRRAEAAGFDALWTADHLAIPQTMNSEYTLTREPRVIKSEGLRENMGRNLEMIVTLSVAAAVTSRVLLGTGVLVLPIRNPVLNARQLASLDLYSGGRLVVGVGVGWLEEEANAMGMPWDRRGARSEEHIALLRSIWLCEDDVVSFDGEFYPFPPIDPEPRPKRRIPILVGGHSERAIKRAVAIGDGWIAGAMSLDRAATAMERLRRACHEAGRDASELFVVCGSSQLADSQPGGGPAAIEALEGYRQAGAQQVQVQVSQSSEAAALEGLDWWAREVFAPWRGS